LSDLPYLLYRLDRKERRGGGVCCLAKGNLCVYSVDHVTPNKADVLCLELFCPHKATRVRFSVVYRPPNSTKSEDEELIEALQDIISAQANSVILGDFNLLIDWDNLRALNSSSTRFLEFFQQSFLQQHVSLPTHENNVLDLVLSTFPNVSEVSTAPPLANSDHASVRFKLLEEFRSDFALPSPDFSKVDYKRLDAHFSNIEWLTLFEQYDSMDDIYRRFCRIRLHLYLRKKFNSKPGLPTLEDPSGTRLHVDSAKAEALGRYFAGVFLAPSPSSDGDLEKVAIVPQCGIPDIYFHPNDVRSLLKRLKPSHSEPFDGIPQ
ncbi:hypothetical protein COOONC_20438, partial [Cooperia oncophora]